MLTLIDLLERLSCLENSLKPGSLSGREGGLAPAALSGNPVPLILFFLTNPELECRRSPCNIPSFEKGNPCDPSYPLSLSPSPSLSVQPPRRSETSPRKTCSALTGLGIR